MLALSGELGSGSGELVASDPATWVPAVAAAALFVCMVASAVGVVLVRGE